MRASASLGERSMAHSNGLLVEPFQIFVCRERPSLSIARLGSAVRTLKRKVAFGGEAIQTLFLS
jgi:hypothetical protein